MFLVQLARLPQGELQCAKKPTGLFRADVRSSELRRFSPWLETSLQDFTHTG